MRVANFDIVPGACQELNELQSLGSDWATGCEELDFSPPCHLAGLIRNAALTGAVCNWYRDRRERDCSFLRNLLHIFAKLVFLQRCMPAALALACYARRRSGTTTTMCTLAAAALLSVMGRRATIRYGA